MPVPARPWFEVSAIETQARAAAGGGGPTWDLAEAVLRGVPSSAGTVAFEVDTYPDPQGTRTLRQRIAARENAKYGLQVTADHIVVTNGATEALFLLAHTFLAPGDHAVVQAPSLLLYRDIIENHGASVVAVDPGVGSDADPAAAMRTSPRLTIVHNPSNPRGSVLEPAALSALADAAAAGESLLVVDQVYDELFAMGSRGPEQQWRLDAGHLVKVNSVSKSFGAPGLRLGWVTASPGIAAVLTGVAERLRMAVSTVSQGVALRLLEAPLDALSATLLGRRALAADAVGTLLTFAPSDAPSAGIFYWLRLLDPSLSAERLCARALTEAGVRLLPGAAFWRGTDDHVRLSFGAEPNHLAEGLERLATFLSRLPASARV